jgi:anti-sigma B factor antagonist
MVQSHLDHRVSRNSPRLQTEVSGRPEFLHSEQDRAGATYTSLSGELDLANAAEVTEQLAAIRRSGCRTLVVDLVGMTFLDASGIHALLLAQEQAQIAGCDLVFRNPRGIVARVIQVLELDAVLLEQGNVDE